MSASNPNPYAPPKDGLAVPPPGTLAEGACPRCRSANVYKPGFTFWGGVLGPKLLNHTVCRACGYGFNGKTGRSNSTRIAVYLAASFAIATVLVFGLVMFGYVSK
jgi:hypothetical protein